MKLPKTKKGEKKPYIYPYAEYPPRPPETDKRDLEVDELRRVENAPFTDNIKNDQCNPGIAPTIIKEVYMPFKSTNPEISTFIESALVYQNSAHYEQALESFEAAQDLWKKEGGNEKVEELYFKLSIASVFESSGRDEMALDAYLNARDVKLPYSHPDLAFAYCGLGSILYYMEEPAWACRAYLKARQLREERLGGDTVDTATVYNNLGCCMFIMERFKEANAFFELAEAILEVELGPDHQRSLTAKRNLKQGKRGV